MQVDRRRGSGLQSVLQAALQIQAGVSDVIVAGGAESMSNVISYATTMRWERRGRVGAPVAAVSCRTTH